MERPILFSGDMVRAILEGRKTQTRRVIKLEEFKPCTDIPKSDWYFRIEKKGLWSDVSAKRLIESKCPYGQPGTILTTRPTKAGWYDVQWEPGDDWQRIWLFDGGDCWGYNANDDPEGIALDIKSVNEIQWKTVGDILWVREPWRIIGWHDGEPLYLEYKDGTKLEEPGDSSDYDDDKYTQLYLDCSDDCEKAGLKIGENEEYDLQGKDIPTHWRPSIFMPRWASRITIEIVNVRIEKIQDITDEDAIAEGMLIFDNEWQMKNFPDYKFAYEEYLLKNNGNIAPPIGKTPRQRFMKVWNSINGKKYPWESNPWVWVVEFKVIEE